MPIPLAAAMLIGSGIQGLSGLISGGKSASAMRQQAAALQEIANLQKQNYQTGERYAEPFREALYPQILDILKGGTSVTQTPLYGLDRNPLEEQYLVAKEALGSTRPGGALTRALRDLEINRAENVGAIPGKLYREFMQPGMDIAGLNIGQGMQGLQGATQTRGGLFSAYGDLFSQSQQQLSQAGIGLGQSIYDMLMKGGGGPNPILSV